MTSEFANWPPTLSQEQQNELFKHATDYAFASGLLMKSKNPSAQQAIHAPFALFPSPFPRHAFDHALQLQPLFNKLVHAISLDQEFIEKTFSDLSQYDPFTARLYDIWRKTRQSITKDNILLGIHRSDYMLHHKDGKMGIQQVEINTIAASFAALSSKTAQVHKYLAARELFFNEADPSTIDVTVTDLPPNKALFNLSSGLAEAWKLYGNPNAHILMVVQPNERNMFDQRAIEYQLFETYKIRVTRKTLAQISREGKLDETGSLIVSGIPISVVYFRSGYGPGDYPTEIEWQARLLMEKSISVKCPSVGYQLVGAKKVQQILALPGIVEKYLNPDESLQIRSCFAGLYPLDKSEMGIKARQLSLENPDRYVMKPQREGGGNNFFGQDIVKQLKSMSEAELQGHILMERIFPPPFKNALVKEGGVVNADVVSELGIYGVWLSKDNQPVVNSVAGHLLRTKSKDTNEGGVAAGFAVIDSPLLF